MQKNLVIVESPAKAKTIEKFLGKDYKVMSSYGHICDLKKKEFSINTETFEPEYEIPAEKEKLVSTLKSEVKKISWSPWTEVRKNTLVVVVVIAVCAIGMAIVDYVFLQGITALGNLF